jgi:hypothetical protein
MNRILRAVAIVVGVGTILSFCTCYCYLINELMPSIDTNQDMGSQQDELQREAERLFQDIYENPRSDLNLLFVGLLALTTLMTFWQAHWAALRTTTPQEAAGHAMVVGVLVVVSYGVLLLLFAPVPLGIKFLFVLAALVASYAAGRIAGQKIESGAALAPAPIPGFGTSRPPFAPGAPSFPPGQLGSALGGSPDVYYNMGVSAAMGGRREEARQHFTHVLQMNPRHIAAWLQLANLADTPEQAWNYIQQARAVNPNDPAVQQAVNVIWPKVAANAALSTPPRHEPFPFQPPADLAGTADVPVQPSPPTFAPAAPDSPPSGGDVPLNTSDDVAEPPVPPEPGSDVPQHPADDPRE